MGTNNAIYSELGARWYEANDDPVALLRAESRLRNPWVATHLRDASRVLDIGCGAGFLANDLAREGHRVTGLDTSREALEVAHAYDETKSVRFVLGDAYALPFPDRSFDCVCAMDFLEHVEDPARAIAEAARVLVPGGLFFFHTFDRNPIAWLVAIKGVEWFVRNTPKDLHVLRMFIKPRELRTMCDRAGLRVSVVRGVRPKLSRAFFRMLWTGVVPDDFEVVFTKSTIISYCGYAILAGDNFSQGVRTVP